MEDILEVVLQILGVVIEVVFDSFAYGPWESQFGLSDLWEWIGYLGVCAWLIVSMGNVQWENLDWRSTSTGTVILIGGLCAVVRFGLHHYSVS